MRQISKRRQGERAERRRVVAFVLARDHGCRARELVPEVTCRGPLDPHEVIPRSAWRAGYLEVENVIAVCRAHHDWIDSEPDRAQALGLHRYSWERPY